MSNIEGPKVRPVQTRSPGGIQEIVLVEPDETLRSSLSRDLKLFQIHVQGFTTSSEALGYLRQKRPDVLIADVNISPGDGFVLAQQVRKIEGRSDLPILLTSDVVFRPEVVKEAKDEYRFDDIIPKPYTLQHLIAKLRVLTGAGSGCFRFHQQPTILTHMPEPDLIFLDQLGRVLRDLRSGCLQCDRGDHAVHLYFRNGKLVAVDSGYMSPQELGHELLRRNLIDERQLQELLSRQETRVGDQRDWMGPLLIDRGVIRPDRLADVLAEQAALRFKKLFGWRSGTFRFKEGKSPLPGDLRFNFSLAELIFEAVCEFGNSRQFQEMLEKYPQPLRISPDAPDALVGVQLSVAERRLLREMNRKSLRRAMAEVGIEPERGFTLVMLLLIMGLLESDDAHGNELREQIFGLGAELRSGAVPAATPPASAPMPAGAPAGLPGGPPLGPGPAATPTAGSEELSFSQAYGRAYRYMNLGLMAQAEEEFARAVQMRPGDARALSYLGWCRYKSHEGNESFRAALEVVQRAAALEPTLADAHVLRGRMMMEQGLSGDALDALLKALEVDPGNDEAMEALQALLRDSQEHAGQTRPEPTPPQAAPAESVRRPSPGSAGAPPPPAARARPSRNQ